MLAETHEGLVGNLNFVVWKAFYFKLPPEYENRMQVGGQDQVDSDCSVYVFIEHSLCEKQEVGQAKAKIYRI